MAHELQLSKLHAKSHQNTVEQAECSKGFGRGTLLLRGNRLNRGVLFQCVCVCACEISKGDMISCEREKCTHLKLLIEW